MFSKKRRSGLSFNHVRMKIVSESVRESYVKSRDDVSIRSSNDDRKSTSE